MGRINGPRRTRRGATREQKHEAELATISRLENGADGRRVLALFRKLAKQVWKDISRLPHREPRVHMRDRAMVRQILAACDEREASWSLEANSITQPKSG